MGGTSSKSTIKQLNDIAMDVVNKNVQSCVGAAMQSQLIKIKGTKGDVSITGGKLRQGATVNMKCVFSTETQNKMQSQIAQEMSNFVKAKGGDITGGIKGTNTDQSMDIENIFKTSIHNETVSKQVASTLQEQTISVEDTDGSVVIADFDLEQTASIVAEAIVKSSQYSGVINNIASKLDAKAESEGGGIFSAIFGMFGGMGQMFMYGAALAVIIAVLVGLFFVGKALVSKGNVGKAKLANPKVVAPKVVAPKVAVPKVSMQSPMSIPPPPL